jgi:hypothetical protein
LTRSIRNITPRPIRASGAKDSHGRILEPGAGALYVHMHREAGLAHRHYVLKPWQVRVAAVATSRSMLLLYVVILVSWGWMAGQAARVPLLRADVAALTTDAERLDTLTATLTELQSRYEHVQRLLSAATANLARKGEPVPAPVQPPAPVPSAPRTSQDTSGPPLGGH